ncbi:bifunctional DNA primase/polymerase [Nocardia xishanensis]|uniref:Bifunctional DNA primase/polymerase n=1 Tax=Nocardia xishanensis TaxID=238964 RepID=A0ABW7XCU5_9NOCA
MTAVLDLWAVALAAAARGWPVFPLRPGGKTPAIKHWPQLASTPAQRSFVARCHFAGAIGKRRAGRNGGYAGAVGLDRRVPRHLHLQVFSAFHGLHRDFGGSALSSPAPHETDL